MAHECRTTVHPDLLPDEQLLVLASTLAAKGVNNYVLQQFRSRMMASAVISIQHFSALCSQALTMNTV